MNTLDVSNKRTFVKRLAALLSVFMILITLSACGTNGAAVAPQNTDPVIAGSSAPTSNEPSFAERENANVSSAPEAAGNEANDTTSEETNEEATEEAAMPVLKMKIDGHELIVIWEDNESVNALTELAAIEPITIKMSMYGGFEQVGSLGANLPRNDVQTTTQAGDIVLYSGNQIVVFYGSNSWAYTRLGHIEDKTPQEMTDLLGNGNVVITIETGE